MSTFKIKSAGGRVKKGKAKVRLWFKHPMQQAGQCKDKITDKLTTTIFIQEIVCEHNGNVVMSAKLNSVIAKNPFLSFSFSGAVSGESIKVSWVDNNGKSASHTSKLR